MENQFNYQNEGEPVIVQLSGDGIENFVVSTFEEAFGEHSNASGRGKARREERRAQGGIRGRMATKRGVIQSKRQTNKRARIVNKQENKDIKQGGRLSRRVNRATVIKQIQDMRRPDEEVLEPEEITETDTAVTDDGLVNDVDTRETARAESGNESGNENPVSDQGDDGYDPEQGVPEYPEDDDTEGSEDFIGEEADSQFSNETNDNRKPISPSVMDIARRLVWNEAKIDKLQKQKENYKVGPARAKLGEIHSEIEGCNYRIQELQAALDGYSNARGGSKKASAKREIHAAKKLAWQELHGRKINRRRVRPTVVAAELKPEISEQKIEIPASEFAGGESMNENNTRTVELTSNADGMMSNITPGKVIVGVAILGVAIYVAKKANWI